MSSLIVSRSQNQVKNSYILKILKIVSYMANSEVFFARILQLFHNFFARSILPLASAVVTPKYSPLWLGACSMFVVPRTLAYDCDLVCLNQTVRLSGGAGAPLTTEWRWWKGGYIWPPSLTSFCLELLIDFFRGCWKYGPIIRNIIEKVKFAVQKDIFIS